SMPGDPVRLRRADVLDGDLNVVEAEVTKALEPRAGERDATRDEVRIEVELTGGRDQGLEVVADQWLPARHVDLDDAQLLRLAEYPLPRGRIELGIVARVVEWIGAVHAAEWAAIRQLGDERVRTRLLRHGTSCSKPRSAIVRRNATTSGSTSGASFEYFSASCWTIAATVCSPVHNFRMSALVEFSTRPFSG